MKQMSKSDPTEECSLSLSWKHKLKQNFNSISVGRIFRNKEKCLIVGHEDGVVRTYPLPVSAESTGTEEVKPSLSLETKGGPIQTLVVYDVTKLNNNDLTVADSRGMVTVFSNGQILTRRSVSEHCIQCLRIQHDALGHNSIIVGDTQGHVTAFSPFSEFWRIRLMDASPYKALDVSPHVTCLHVAELCDSNGQRRSYVLVADSCKHLHLIQAGNIVLTIRTPAVVTAMTSGRFIDPEDIDSTLTNGHKALEIQVALGTDTGAIYLMANFQVFNEEFANIQQSVTTLEVFPAADTQSTDSLLCAGHFDALYVLRQGKVSKYRTPAWISSLVAEDINGDGIKEVVFGCHDNSIHGLQIKFS